VSETKVYLLQGYYFFDDFFLKMVKNAGFGIIDGKVGGNYL
jgi:hypothetical protein